MKLTTLDLSISLASAKESSLAKTAIFNNLSISKAGNLDISYIVEVADHDGAIFTPKLSPQTNISYGGMYAMPLIADNTANAVEEAEPKHLKEFKTLILTALEEFLKVELNK